MTVARDRIQFLHDLLDWVHIEETERGYCLRCRSPMQFHPCPVRRRLVDTLIAIGHLPAGLRQDVVTGRTGCCPGPTSVPPSALERAR